MDFFELINKRQSTRKYDASRTVDRTLIDKIIDAGRVAPSACNSQPWHFVVVDDPVLKNEVADATSSKLLNINHFTKQAPVHIIIVEEKVNFSSGFGTIVKNKQYSFLDIGIAATQMCLAAEELGLGSCILGWFAEKKMKKLLNIPRNKRVVLDIIIGYPAEDVRTKKRKPREEVVSYNSYKD